jgi:hypothetical protein
VQVAHVTGRFKRPSARYASQNVCYPIQRIKLRSSEALANEIKMRELVFRGWTFRYDAEATAAAYAAARPVGPEACGCLYCRNFIAAREQAYPAEVKSLAETVGISPLTESEIWEHGATVPERAGLRLYGGFFHFVGEIVHDASEAVEDIFFLKARSLLPRSFGDAPVVQAEFTMNVPWVIDEPPPG